MKNVFGLLSSRGMTSFPPASNLVSSHRVGKLCLPMGMSVTSCSRIVQDRLMSSSRSYGENMSQEDMMMKDMLITTDDGDGIVGPASKYDAHKFTVSTPKGAVHRAFSVFFFNEHGDMMITRRASSKITFPNVWTNTWCSHPLFNQTPDEVDHNSPRDMAERVPPVVSSDNTKYGAIRKLKHELGIDTIDHEDFRFLTRFHYWAADTVTYGTADPKWGEHEIDYIFFVQKPEESVPVMPNPEEVSAYRFVSQQELRDMMADPELLWSPWFRGIMERKGWEYWSKLNEAVDVKVSSYPCISVLFRL